MNYFELYELPVSINLDQELIKKKYYQLSKEYHPDFYITETEEKQTEILELSTLNTKAYDTFKNEVKCIKYILTRYDIIDEGNDKLPQSFLMEMMDMNEQLMELEFDVDESILSKVKNELDNHQEEISKIILPIPDDIEVLNEDEKGVYLQKLKDYYLKRKYLLRIQERLDKFAPPKQND